MGNGGRFLFSRDLDQFLLEKFKVTNDFLYLFKVFVVME
jgi:hypothetical protein